MDGLLPCLDIEVACYHYEGIDAVKAALKKGLEVSTEDMPVKVGLQYTDTCITALIYKWLFDADW